MDIIYYSAELDDFIDRLPERTRTKALHFVRLLRHSGYLLRMPYSRPMGDGLFELRVHGEQEVRILYAYRSDKAILLHWFIKKTEETPMREIQMALRHLREIDEI
jgi:phage-related protein